jgi:hypothetical protein
VHRPHVTALRDALLARHELLGTEITDVLESVEAPAVVDVTDPTGGDLTDPAVGDHPTDPARGDHPPGAVSTPAGS